MKSLRPIRQLVSIVLVIFVLVPTAAAQSRGEWIADRYDKREVMIKMRDGVSLFTVIYSPRDRRQDFPIVLNRTPYSCQPYGGGRSPNRIGPSPYMEEEGYIFVKQDVRGRWMSEGNYDNMRPHVPGANPIDESSDTYDTIEWLLANVPGNNGKVGITGISYPGFYSAAALPEAHPALVAASPQAPIADFFFDDFHHNGAYFLSYWLATSMFGYQHDGPTDNLWFRSVRPPTRDSYQFFLDLGPLSNSSKYYGDDNFFWQQLVEHPNYDEFWQRRGILPHLENITTNVMTVGGWFDAEDLYGPLNIYRKIEKDNPDVFNVLVMGPWSHGQWASRNQTQRVGNIVFGDDISNVYQRDVEAAFFRHFLKGTGEPPRFEALVFDTGRKQWSAFEKWPPAKAVSRKLYFQPAGGLTSQIPSSAEPTFAEFTSDPDNPVPYRKRDEISFKFTPREYMTDDQRFAAQRDDVITFRSDVLDSDVTLSGELLARLMVSTSQSDADWIVKLIDVYPDSQPDDPQAPGVRLAGYQQMVRSEVIRGRFRNDYAKPEPFVPDQVTEVRLPLQDVFHTFQRGHRIMVQVQSTWFPLIDRNPQKYVDNIFKAKKEDFVSATHRIYHDAENASYLEVKVMQEK